MFFEKFESRINYWRDFRDSLEDNPSPIKHTIDFWNKAPISAKSCDPYDNSTWLKAWQLIDENRYCDFSKILAIYYTLSLTNRFKDCRYEIKIAADREKQKLYYLLFVDDIVIGYLYDTYITSTELPNLWIQYSCVMTDHLE
jgi:hypothetical protein